MRKGLQSRIIGGRGTRRCGPGRLVLLVVHGCEVAGERRSANEIRGKDGGNQHQQC